MGIKEFLQGANKALKKSNVSLGKATTKANKEIQKANVAAGKAATKANKEIKKANVKLKGGRP